MSEAERIRDDICASAPAAMVEAYGDDKWGLAIMCAESYYRIKFLQEEGSYNPIPKPEPKTGLDTQYTNLLKLSMEGKRKNAHL